MFFVLEGGGEGKEGSGNGQGEFGGVFYPFITFLIIILNAAYHDCDKHTNPPKNNFILLDCWP